MSWHYKSFRRRHSHVKQQNRYKSPQHLLITQEISYKIHDLVIRWINRLLQIVWSLTACELYMKHPWSLSRRTQAFPSLSLSKISIRINEATDYFVTQSSELKLNDTTVAETISNLCLCYQKAGYCITKINHYKLYSREFVFNEFPQKFATERKSCRFCSVKERGPHYPPGMLQKQWNTPGLVACVFWLCCF